MTYPYGGYTCGLCKQQIPPGEEVEVALPSGLRETRHKEHANDSADTAPADMTYGES